MDPSLIVYINASYHQRLCIVTSNQIVKANRDNNHNEVRANLYVCLYQSWNHSKFKSKCSFQRWQDKIVTLESNNDVVKHNHIILAIPSIATNKSINFVWFLLIVYVTIQLIKITTRCVLFWKKDFSKGNGYLEFLEDVKETSQMSLLVFLGWHQRVWCFLPSIGDNLFLIFSCKLTLCLPFSLTFSIFFIFFLFLFLFLYLFISHNHIFCSPSTDPLLPLFLLLQSQALACH